MESIYNSICSSFPTGLVDVDPEIVSQCACNMYVCAPRRAGKYATLVYRWWFRVRNAHVTLLIPRPRYVRLSPFVFDDAGEFYRRISCRIIKIAIITLASKTTNISTTDAYWNVFMCAGVLVRVPSYCPTRWCYAHRNYEFEKDFIWKWSRWLPVHLFLDVS